MLLGRVVPAQVDHVSNLDTIAERVSQDGGTHGRVVIDERHASRPKHHRPRPCVTWRAWWRLELVLVIVDHGFVVGVPEFMKRTAGLVEVPFLRCNEQREHVGRITGRADSKNVRRVEILSFGSPGVELQQSIKM